MIKQPLAIKEHEPWPAFNLVTAVMLAAALVSAVSLDYINSRKGERSYLFRAKEIAPAAVEEGKPQEEPAIKPELGTAEEETKAGQAPASGKAAATARKRIRGYVALIVDDMGSSLETLDELLALKEPLTISVLPYSPYAQETARVAHENNLEVLLHLPLESLNNSDAMTAAEGLIMSTMSPEEIAQAFEASLARVPFADGVNNHMGSKFTAEVPLMEALLEPMKNRNLLFVDSRTTAKTVAYNEALKMGIPAAKRDVFLDADADRSRIRGRLVELFRAAQKRGRAVGICHPFPETLQVLKSSFRMYQNYGLEVVPVSILARK
jgi:polysaccharide deacetylase 2 family uncharacterized protein YibQ